MKVYVLTTHEVWDYEDLGINNTIFAKKQDAIKAFKEWKSNVKTLVKENGWIVETATPTYYEAFEEGCYCTNHVLGKIMIHDIE